MGDNDGNVEQSVNNSIWIKGYQEHFASAGVLIETSIDDILFREQFYAEDQSEGAPNDI